MLGCFEHSALVVREHVERGRCDEVQVLTIVFGRCEEERVVAEGGEQLKLVIGSHL